MTNAESDTPVTGILAVKDQAGNYYAVPQATLEQCRVPAAHTAELEQLISAASAQGGAHADDAHGHSPVAAGIAAAAAQHREEQAMTMTDTQTTALVLKDGAGDYFVLPQQVLERWRLPEEYRGEIERLVTEGRDVEGFVAPLVMLGLMAWGGASTLGGYKLAEWYDKNRQEEVQVPTIQIPTT